MFYCRDRTDTRDACAHNSLSAGRCAASLNFGGPSGLHGMTSAADSGKYLQVSALLSCIAEGRDRMGWLVEALTDLD